MDYFGIESVPKRYQAWKSLPTSGLLITNPNLFQLPVQICGAKFTFSDARTALLVFTTGTVFLLADLAFGWRLGVVNAMLHALCCTKEGEDRLKVVIG